MTLSSSSSSYFSGLLSYVQPVPYRELGLTSEETDQFLNHLKVAFNCKARTRDALQTAPAPTVRDDGTCRSLVWTFAKEARLEPFGLAYQNSRLGVYRWDRLFPYHEQQIKRPDSYVRQVEAVLSVPGSNFPCPKERPLLKAVGGRVMTLSATLGMQQILKEIDPEVTEVIGSSVIDRDRQFAARRTHENHRLAQLSARL